MSTGWRLGVILVVFAAVAAVLRVAPPAKGAVNPSSLLVVPMALGEWSATVGIPEEILPLDPNEKLSLRRTYRNGPQLAWVSVGLFVGQDDEARRASVNKLYPQQRVSRIEPVSFAVSLTGAGAKPVTLPTVIIHQGSQHLLVTYWHQMESRVYGSEYHFRLALMRDLIFARRADSLLVRIAVPVGADGHVRERLDTVGHLAVPLYLALAPEGAQ